MSWTEINFGEEVSPLLVLGVILANYLLGCFTTGYYLVRARTGQDIRRMGSGSTGARNVGRTLGSAGFILTMCGDLAKGGLAVWATIALTGNDRLALLAWLAVVVGHIWPVQLGLHGGKGVATSLAGLLVYDARLAGIFCLVFGITMAVTRRSVASSLLAYLILPAASAWLGRDHARIWGISVLAGLVLIAHYRNIAEGIHDLWPRRSVASEPEESVKEL